MTVFNQKRIIEIGSKSLEGLDSSITVKNPKDSDATFDIKIWNLTESTWDSIQTGKGARVRLGWEEGKTKAVIFGVIKKKNKEIDGSDIKYRIKGKDKSQEQTKLRISKTWNDKSPDQIAGSIGNELGLTTGQIDSVGSPIDGYYQISKDKPARYWLDQLVGEAQARDSKAWEWFTDTGKLYFVRKDGIKGEAVELSYDNTLISIGPAGGEEGTQEGNSALKFKAMMEPTLRKGSAVAVNTDKYSGAYKVTEYTFKSSTDTGEHMVEGTLTSLDSNYTVRDDHTRAHL